MSNAGCFRRIEEKRNPKKTNLEKDRKSLQDKFYNRV